MDAPAESQGYSSLVNLWLECGHGNISLSQVGSQFVIASPPRSVPRCEASVVIVVDGREHRRPVYLVNGMTENDIRTEVAELAPF